MRPEKQAMVQEIREALEKSKFAVLVDYRGLKSDQMTDLRARLRSEKAQLKVAKNSFVGNAAKDLGWAGLSKFLAGPTAMITGAGDVTLVAKVIKAYTDENKLPKVKGGMLEGKVVQPADVESLASLPAREILLSILVGTIAAPMTKLVGAMDQKLASLVYVLKAIEEKKTQASK